LEVWRRATIISESTQPILYLGEPISEAMPIVPPRWPLSLAMPSQKGTNGHAEHLRGRCSICPTLFKVRPSPSGHIVLLDVHFLRQLQKPFAIEKDH